MEKKSQHIFNSIKNECMDWHYANRDNAHEFFWQLRDDGRVYSPSLGIAVLWCEWMAGGEVVDRTFEVVLDLTPDALKEHVHFIEMWGGWDRWATDLLADFDHFTFDLSDESDVKSCITTLAAVCTAPDWTSDPRSAICNK